MTSSKVTEYNLVLKLKQLKLVVSRDVTVFSLKGYLKYSTTSVNLLGTLAHGLGITELKIISMTITRRSEDSNDYEESLT